MTVLAGTTGFGYAVGSTVAGRLADWGGHTPAFAVTVAAGALATILSLAGGATLRREFHESLPVGEDGVMPHLKPRAIETRIFNKLARPMPRPRFRLPSVRASSWPIGARPGAE